MNAEEEGASASLASRRRAVTAQSKDAEVVLVNKCSSRRWCKMVAGERALH